MTALAIALKDLRLLARDRAAVLFLVLVPIAVITIIAETQGDEDWSGLTLPVANEDQGPVAQVLVEALAKRVDIIEVDPARAEEMVGEQNNAPAALLLPERLSKNYLAGLPSTLTLLTDPVKGIEVATIKAFLLLADKEASTLADPLYEELMVLEERNATGSRLTIPQLEVLVPGFSLMFVLMGLFFGVAFGLRDEQDWGVLTRLRIAPISAGSFLCGKLGARFLVGVGQLLLLFGFGRLVWGVSLGPSIPAFLLLALAIVFGMTGFSLLASSFARTREQVIPLGLAVIMIACAIGGCWWPLYDAPVWLQRAAYAFVTAWSLQGFHDLMLRERDLLQILPTLGVLIAYGSVCLALGVRLHRFRGLTSANG